MRAKCWQIKIGEHDKIIKITEMVYSTVNCSVNIIGAGVLWVEIIVTLLWIEIIVILMAWGQSIRPYCV